MNLLIIDDEEEILHSFARVLDSLGHTCVTCRSAEDALVRYMKGGFDVVITDYKMPEKSGLELLVQLKKINPNVFVIVLTGFGSLEVALDALGKGAYYYMTKPLDFDELEIVLQRIGMELDIRNRLQTLRA